MVVRSGAFLRTPLRSAESDGGRRPSTSPATPKDAPVKASAINTRGLSSVFTMAVVSDVGDFGGAAFFGGATGVASIVGGSAGESAASPSDIIGGALVSGDLWEFPDMIPIISKKQLS